MDRVTSSFPNNGGLFLWAASHDSDWSQTVGDWLRSVSSPTPSPSPSPNPASSPTPSPSPSHGNCESHQIVAGDTLTTIAMLFTNAGKVVTAQQICDFNSLFDCNLIIVGDFLVIPYAGSPSCIAGTNSSSTTTTSHSSSTTTTKSTTTPDDEPISSTQNGHPTPCLLLLSLPLLFTP